MSARIESVRTVYEGWARYLVAQVRLDDGTRLSREIEDHGQAVAVLPYDPGRRVATLVSQLRAPVLHAGGAAGHLEAPAGLLDREAPEDAGRREVLEETGLRLADLEPMARVWTMPGLSTERMSLFLAPYTEADRQGAGGGLAAEGEAITVHEVPLAELAAMAADGRITDMKTLLLVFALQLRRPDLFGA